MSSELMTASDVARVLGCSAETVRNLHRRGELDAMITDSGWRIFLRSDVLRIAAQRRRNRR